MPIIAVSGKAQSGKDTFATVAKEEFGYLQTAFANAVKWECEKFLTQVEIFFKPENFWGTDDEKNAHLDMSILSYMYAKNVCPAFEQFIENRAKFCANCNTYHFSGRQLMQWWGTEYRRSQDPDYWIKQVLHQITTTPGNYVITDLRFKNEAAACRDANYTLVRVNREDKVIAHNSHASEVDLDDWQDWDAQFQNNSTLDEYKANVREYLTFCESTSSLGKDAE